MAVAVSLISVGLTAGTLGIMAGLADGSRRPMTRVESDCAKLLRLCGVQNKEEFSDALAEYKERGASDEDIARCAAQLRDAGCEYAVLVVGGGQGTKGVSDDEGEASTLAGTEDGTLSGARWVDKEEIRSTVTLEDMKDHGYPQDAIDHVRTTWVKTGAEKWTRPTTPLPKTTAHAVPGSAEAGGPAQSDVSGSETAASRDARSVVQPDESDASDASDASDGAAVPFAIRIAQTDGVDFISEVGTRASSAAAGASSGSTWISAGSSDSEDDQSVQTGWSV